MTRRILIVGPSWVGDMVMAQSLALSLKRQHPDSCIDMLAPAWSLPIIERMPEIHRGIEFPVGHGELGLGKLWRLGRTLRAERYQQAIVLPRKMKAALVPFFAGVPQRTGYRGELRFGLINDRRPLNKAVLQQTVQRYVALGQSGGGATQPPEVLSPQLRIDVENQNACVERLGLSRDRPAIGFMPGAEYGPAKQWPAEYFGQLAADLVARGQQVWVLGSAKEQALGETIRQAAGEAAEHVHNLCGRTALADVVDLLAACETAVSNDSGLMHVAAASGTAIVAIYGSSTPDFTPPLTEKAEVLYLRLDCSPCFKRQCPLGHTHCLRKIDPQSVLTHIPAA